MTVPEHPAPPDPTATPWPQYADAVVELVVAGTHLVLTPDDSAADGPGPSSLVAALVDPGPPVWVLTAGDPYPLTLTASENAARNVGLRAELDALGVVHDPALGRSPDGSTSERSTAVRGTDRATVLAVAARHGQLAVFEIADRIRCIDVATASEVTVRPFRLERAAVGSGLLVGPTGWEG